MQHPFAVDREREVVVERLRQVPPARLLRRDVDPAIEADALGLHVGGLPGRVRASEVGEVAVALERIVFEGGVTPRVRGAGSVRAVLSPLRAGVSAEADPRPGGRRVGRDGKRGRAVGYHDGRRRAGNHVRDDGAGRVVTRPVRRNREVGGRRRGGCARPLRGDGRGGVARHRYHVPGEGCREVHGVRQLHVVEDAARRDRKARCGEGDGLAVERRGVEEQLGPCAERDRTGSRVAGRRDAEHGIGREVESCREAGREGVRAHRRIRRQLVFAEGAVPDANLVVAGVGVMVGTVFRHAQPKVGVRRG